MKTPYLIQTATIHTPLASGDVRLSKAVELDYMGSAEFEFGALPKSLRALQKGVLKLRIVSSITENNVPLRVLSMLSDEEFEEYTKYLLRLRNEKRGKIDLKENSHFDPSERFSWSKVDFWWDIENHVMWSFHKPFMKRLEEHLKSSFKYMDEQKTK
jgi:hypothetical protein